MIPRFKPFLDYKDIISLFKYKKGTVEYFENLFKTKFDAIDAIAFPYGRSAQWAFFKALNIKNSEIIMPAYTCSVVAHAITLSGNKPKFIDINLSDFNMNLYKLEEAINENTSAIIATHTFGYPQNIDWIKDIINKSEKKYGKKIWFINDCCHSFGAKWNKQMVGSTGDVAVYAFNISKILTSIFGGILTFQDSELASRVRSYRDRYYKHPNWEKYIIRRLYLITTYFLFNPKLYKLVWALQHNTPILNPLTKSYHLDNKIHFPPDYLDFMMDFEASIGINQLNKYDSIIQKRISKAKFYNKALSKRKEWILPPIIDGATYSHYSVRVPNKKIILQEYAKKGIELGELIQYSIPELTSYKHIDSNCPNALQASQTTINFPLL